MSFRIIALCTTLIASLVSNQAKVSADELSVPKDSKLVLHMDVQAFLNTKLGQHAVEMTKALASKELKKDSDEVLKQVSETLGFDPLEEIQSITVVASRFNSKMDLAGVEMEEVQGYVQVKMKKTSGNIEGLLLAVPSYRSSEFGNYTIHSTSNDDMTGFAAVHKAKNGNHSLVLAMKEDDVQSVLKQLDGKSELQQFSIEAAGNFLDLILPGIPAELANEGVPKYMVEMIQSAQLSIGQKEGNIFVDVRSVTDDEKRAEQMQQMIEGLKAMVGLLEEDIGDDEEMRAAIEMLEQVAVDRDGTKVVVHGEIPAEVALEFLREEAKLPL